MKATRVIASGLMAMAASLFAASAASAAPSNQDSTWMVAAHQSNLAEIAAGQVAQQQASSQSVKDTATMFIQMHTTLDASLTSGAATLGVTLPKAPSPAQQASLAQVKTQTGTAFDTAWVAQQIAGHRDALSGTQTEVSSGSDAAVLKLANTTLPVVQQHLSELLKLSGAPVAVAAGSGGQAASSASPTVFVPAAVLAAGGVLLLALALTLVRRRRAA